MRNENLHNYLDRLASGGSYVLWAERGSLVATGTGTPTAFTQTLPGGTLGTSRGLRVSAFIERTSGSGLCTPQMSYGGSLVATVGALSGNAQQMIQGHIWGDGSTAAQRGFVIRQPNAAAQFSAGTTAIDSTQPKALSIEIALGTASDQWTARWWCVELLAQ